MSLPHGILGFLSYGKMTGYELAKAFGSSIYFIWHAQTSQVYLELGKLEQKQLVSCELVMQTEKPNKKVYSITEAGRNAFINWLNRENPAFSRGMKNEFLMKVFFSGSNTSEKSIKMLRQFAADCRSYLEEQGRVPSGLVAQYKSQVNTEQVVYWDFAVDFVHCYTRMCIDWADRCIQRLEDSV